MSWHCPVLVGEKARMFGVLGFLWHFWHQKLVCLAAVPWQAQLFFFGGTVGAVHVWCSSLLWMDKILHHLATMVETIVCWYLQDNRFIPGLLRWCEMDFVHPHYGAWYGGPEVTEWGVKRTGGLSDASCPQNWCSPLFAGFCKYLADVNPLQTSPSPPPSRKGPPPPWLPQVEGASAPPFRSQDGQHLKYSDFLHENATIELRMGGKGLKEKIVQLEESITMCVQIERPEWMAAKSF